MLKNNYCLKCVFFTNVKKTNILNMSLALYAVCKGTWWGPSLWWTHGEIPYHWFANDDDDDDDDHDDWWWWSLWSRWPLTTFFFHRKTASWPPSPGGFWPTMFFPLVIFGQPSLFVSFFPINVKVGWFFFPHCLKNDIFTVCFLICAASQLRISKKLSHRDHMEFARLIEFAGVDKELRCRLYWDCQWWAGWSKWLQWCCYDCEWRSGCRW